VAVVGATGRSGLALCRALQRAGTAFVPVVRDAARWTSCGLAIEPRVADLADGAALMAALDGAGTVVSAAHAVWTASLIAAAPSDAVFVLMGSARRFSRWPDSHGDGVRAGEGAFLAAVRRGVMVHPTLIYGRDGGGDVQRLAALLSRLPFAPLPGGGRALVQPIHQDDVTRCLIAAMGRRWDTAETIVIAGPRPVPYRDFVQAVAAAAGLRRPRLLPLPAPALQALARIGALVPGLPRVGGDEIRRLTEDKAFDIAAMRDLLGVVPIGLEEGLGITLGAHRHAA
jgi:nucleoside-diphosphate-sugar epimerase